VHESALASGTGGEQRWPAATCLPTTAVHCDLQHQRHHRRLGQRHRQPCKLHRCDHLAGAVVVDTAGAAGCVATTLYPDWTQPITVRRTRPIGDRGVQLCVGMPPRSCSGSVWWTTSPVGYDKVLEVSENPCRLQPCTGARRIGQHDQHIGRWRRAADQPGWQHHITTRLDMAKAALVQLVKSISIRRRTVSVKLVTSPAAHHPQWRKCLYDAAGCH